MLILIFVQSYVIFNLSPHNYTLFWQKIDILEDFYP